MRALTPEEMELVAGADGSTVTAVTVTGVRPGTGSGFTGGGIPGWSGGGSTGGPATGSSGPARAGVLHTTPHHLNYITNVNLDAAQTQVLDNIFDTLSALGHSQVQITNAISQAYHESRLGANAVSDGIHIGLLQYDQASFNHFNPGGNINSNDAQIRAMHNELNEFPLSRYQSGVSSGAIPSSLSYDEYLEYKHHQPYGDGGATAGTAWTTYQATYDRDRAALGWRWM